MLVPQIHMFVDIDQNGEFQRAHVWSVTTLGRYPSIRSIAASDSQPTGGLPCWKKFGARNARRQCHFSNLGSLFVLNRSLEDLIIAEFTFELETVVG